LQRKIIKKNPAKTRRNKALSTALREIALAKKDIKPDTTIATLSRILQNYITYKFGISAVGSTLHDLSVELSKNVSDPDVVNELIPFIERLDSFRFSGMRSDNSAINATADALEILIRKLDAKEIRK